MVAPVNNDLSELQQVIAGAFTRSNEIVFLIAAARKGSSIEELPRLNRVNEEFKDQNLSISLIPRGSGESKEYTIYGFKSAKWDLEKNGNRKLIVSSNGKEDEVLELSNSQTTVKFEKLASDLERPDLRTRPPSQEFFDQTKQAEIARIFHAGLVKPATVTVSDTSVKSDIPPIQELQLHWKYSNNKESLNNANQIANKRFKRARVAVYVNDQCVEAISSLSNNPFTLRQKGKAIGIKDSSGKVHILDLTERSTVSILENPLSKEEAQLARAIDVSNQESEWGREFLQDGDNLQQVNERLLQEGFCEGGVSVYKNGDLRAKIKSLRTANPLSRSDKGFVIYDALDQPHLINLSDGDVLRIVKKKPPTVKTYLLDPVETRVAVWKSFLAKFIKPKTRQQSKKEKLEFDFTDSVEQHKLSRAYKQLSYKGFLKREVEIYSGKQPIFKGFLREGDDALVYDSVNRQIKIYNQDNQPTIFKRANFKVITFVKTDRLAPQDLTLKANSVQDFVKQLEGFIARLPDSCTLKIEGLKDPQGQDLNLDSNTRVSWQRLKPPREVWILNENPYKIEPELGRKYSCSIEKLKQAV